MFLHGRGLDFIGEDGVKRFAGLTRCEGGTIQLDWKTWWNGNDNPPAVTVVRLSMDGLNAMQNLLAEFMHNPGAWPDPTEKGEPTP